MQTITKAESAPKKLADIVYRELEDMIIGGRYACGEHINEYALSERRGISRGPIREACRRLERAGLLEFKTNRGFFVRDISVTEVLDIYDVRAALFAHAGRILARRITDFQLEELTALHGRMMAACNAGENDDFYRLNRLFHSRLMQFTGNSRLSSVYEELDRELLLWRKRALLLDSNVRASAEDHGHLLDVLRGGNPAQCARSLRDHSLAGRNRLLRTMPDQVGDRGGSPWLDEDA